MQATDPAASDTLILSLGGQAWGLGVRGVRELLRAVEILPTAGRPGVEGVIDVRGEVIPVLDLRGRLGLPPKEVTPADCLILVERAGGPIALRVDGVGELVAGPGASAGYARTADGRPAAMLDLDALFGDEPGGA